MKYVNAKRNSLVASVVNSILNRALKFASSCLERRSLHLFKYIYTESSRSSSFVTICFLVCWMWSHIMFISGTSLVFLLKLIKQWLITIQSNMYCWWIKTDKNLEFKSHDNIGRSWNLLTFHLFPVPKVVWRRVKTCYDHIA